MGLTHRGKSLLHPLTRSGSRARQGCRSQRASGLSLSYRDQARDSLGTLRWLQIIYIEGECGLRHRYHAGVELRSKSAQQREVPHLAECGTIFINQASLLLRLLQVKCNEDDLAAIPLHQFLYPDREISSHRWLGGECEYQRSPLPGSFLEHGHPELFTQPRERLRAEWKHRANCVDDEVIVKQRNSCPGGKMARDSQFSRGDLPIDENKLHRIMISQGHPRRRLLESPSRHCRGSTKSLDGTGNNVHAI